jgi:plastocyanin
VTDGPSRAPRIRYRALPWFVAGLLLLSIGLPSAAGLSAIPVAPEVGFARALANVENVTLNLTDRPSFSPQFLSIPAGSTVSIHIVNRGLYVHSFTLCATPGARLSPNLSPSGVYAFFAANRTLANVSLGSGGEGWANLTFSTSEGFDTFEYASVVPYQFQSGMWGLLNITSQVAGLALSENTTDALAFVPNVLSASPTHYPIVVAVLVTNEGSFGHTFTMAPQTNVTLLPSNFTTYFAAHPPLVNQAVPAVPGGTVWANFTVAAPGVYQYICEVSGHFANGMYGFLYVGVPVPAPPAAPSTAIVQGWVLVGSAVLLGIGAVLVAVAALAGRFPPRANAPGGHS